METECLIIRDLFNQLCSQPKHCFPRVRQPLDVPCAQGVYIIRKGDVILHVGRTIKGKGDLHQRLANHLHAASSFTNGYLKGRGAVLREPEYAYQYLKLVDPRPRALLEAYAIGMLCPKHIGLGVSRG